MAQAPDKTITLTQDQVQLLTAAIDFRMKQIERQKDNEPDEQIKQIKQDTIRKYQDILRKL